MAENKSFFKYSHCAHTGIGMHSNQKPIDLPEHQQSASLAIRPALPTQLGRCQCYLLRQSRKRPKLEYTSSNSNSSTTTLDVSVIDVAESTGTDPAESEELDEWPETHFADAQVNI